MNKFPSFVSGLALLFSATLVHPGAAQNIGTALVNGAPVINGGTVEGNVQQMTGATATLNSGAVITSDLLVPGTPTLVLNGTPIFGGIIVGSGSASPSNYQVILNGSPRLGHLRTRTNPVALPVLPPVPTPAGTRSVTITAPGQSVGNFATLRNLTLNGNVGQYAIPAGTYGDFIANAGGGFTLGVAGAQQPAIYNLQHLTLNGATNIIVLGPVVINVANGFTANGAAGTSANPAWLKLNIRTGAFTVNGGCTLYGYATVPNGRITINGTAKLIGGATCKDLTVNAYGLLRLFDAASFDNQPPVVAITSPAAGAVFNAGTPIPLVASATDAGGSVSKVEFFAGTTKLGEATSSPWTYSWQNAAVGSYQLTAVATDNLGAKTTSAAVSIRVNAPPTVALTSPASQSVFQPGSAIPLSASAADSDGTIQKVEFFADGVKLGEKTAAPYTFSWTNALTGPHALTARATDNNGAQTVSATVNIRVNAAPTVTMTAPVNGTVAQAGSAIPLAASANDSDGTIAKVEFYAGATKVGEDTSSPYQFTWNNAPAGQHSLTAKATDNDGAQTTSAPVNLTINAPPAVGISSPAAAQIFNPGDTIAITANASDPDGTVTKVEFFAGSNKIGESSAAPWTISWPAPAPGPYQLSAVATDNRGAQTTSSSVSITINAPPTVAISSPSDQAVMQPGNPIVLTANASDTDGTIAKVEFFSGATKLGEDSSAPFSFSWNNATSGSYTLTAKATDNAAASTVSAPIHLRVNALPAVSLTNPAQGATFNTGDVITLSANATDPDDGITKVEFFAGGAKIGEASASPYSITWSGAPEGASTLTARAEDGSGASATSAPITINVTTVNSELTVDAGPDRLISLPGAATLEGQVLLNGGPPGPDVALQWSVQSGPGPVTFSTPNSTATSAAFTQPGNYLIRLTASNVDGANFDTVAVTVLPAPQAGPDSPISNKGREFWMAFLSGLPPGGEPDHAGAFLFISSEEAASGTVEISETYLFDGAWQTYKQVRNFTVPAGGKTLVAVEGFWQPVYEGHSDHALQTAVHIIADVPVAVHALSSNDQTTDGSLILPTGMLGRDYFIMSYNNSLSFYPGSQAVIGGTELAVVAIHNETQVTITPTASTVAHPAGQPFTVTLQRGDVYRMINKTDVAGDFTGTRVQSDKPVAVYGGHTCATVPGSTAACDHLYEQMTPVDFWGRHFVTLPLATRHNGDRFRIMAEQDNTHVSINGQIVAILNRGQFHETVLAEPASILADQRILLAQFAQSSAVDNTTGDPFMGLIPPYEEFGRHYILSTQAIHSYWYGGLRDIFDSYLSVIVDSAHTGSVSINGQAIASSQFVPIGDSGFSGATVPLAKDSTFDISSPTPIGTWIYGWANYESYGFTGGLYAELDAGSADFGLTQSSSEAPIGTTHRVRAHFNNAASLPVPGARVDFVVTGANPVTGFGYTAADGTVEFSWVGAQAGTDTVTATVGTFTATATVNWISNPSNQPPQVNAGPDRLVVFGQPLTLQGLAQDDGLPAGGQLVLQWSALPGSGDVTFSDPASATTTATFVYPGQYHLRLTAYDGQFSGEDEMVVNVDIPPEFTSLEPSGFQVDQGKEWSVVVNARDLDGTIVSVELLEGAQVLARHEQNDRQVYYLTLSTVLTTLGQHSITVRLTDDLGATTDRVFEVTVRPAPTVQILTPADNTTFAAGESVSFTASASSAGGPIVRVVYNDVTYYTNEIGDGTGSDYQFTWTPTYAGTFLITATAYDSEGASGTSAPITITVLSPGDPTIVITSPQEGSSYYPGQSATFHVDATAPAPATVEGVYFFDGYDYLGSSYSPPYEIQWYAGSNGAHTLRAEVWDTFGGHATTSITVNSIEVPNLNVTLVEPAPNIPIKVNTPTALTVHIENVIGTLDWVDFYVNGYWIAGGSSSSSATWTPAAVGEYEIEVDAYSSGPGQFGYTITNVTVADLHSPVVEWTAPANNASFAPNTPIVLQAQTSDIDSNLAKLQFIADGLLLSETPLSGGAGVASFTWENAGPGWHALTALAVDDTIQSSGALLRVFVERTVANDLLPPSALTSETISANTIHLAWTPSISANATATVIERRAGMTGTWEEVATTGVTIASHEDTALEPETYYSYRLAALDASGARSNYSTESSATTKVQLPQYAVVDLGENLDQSFVALNQIDNGFLYAKANGMFPSAAVLELKDADVMSMDEANNVLLKKRDTTNGQNTECYFLWHPDHRPPSNPHPPDSICDPHFRAFRLSRDGVVAGAVDHSTANPSAVPDWIYRGLEFWSGISSLPGKVREDGTRIDVRAATWTAAGGVHELVPADEREYRYDRLDISPPRKLPNRFDSLFSAWDVSTNGTVVGTGSWSDLRGIDPSTSLETFSSYESFTLPHGMRWKSESWDTLGSLRRQSSSEGESIATAINPLGTIVVGGSAAPDRAGDPAWPTHAMRSRMLFGARPLQPGDPALQDLAPLGTGSYAWAWDVDANGNAVGYSTKAQADPISRTHAVLWKSDSTAALELPNLGGRDPTFFPDGFGYAHAINATGDRIVGKSITQDIFTVGTVWALNANNGGGAPTSWEAHDLNAHVPSDWFVVNALDVNNKGYMVGTAFHTVPNPANPQGPPIQVRRGVLLIPVEFLEVTPKTKDEAGNEIANSEKPKPRPESNELIEEPRPGQIPNVAYRKLKIRIPHSTAGDKIKWSMVPLFTPDGQSEPRFRGQWPQEHPDRFETNGGGGASYGFERLSQEEARTQVDANGETAIRINLPPIGFSKAGVRLEIEKFPGATAEIIFEVPAVVVIDPGHGGPSTPPKVGGSMWNKAQAPLPPAGSGTLEKTMTLDFGLLLRDRLMQVRTEEHLLLKIYTTRTTDINLGLAARAGIAKEKGADIFLSIHFNGFNKTARGTETHVDHTGNYNQPEDFALAGRINTAAYEALRAHDPGADNRGPKDEEGLDALSDDAFGNTNAYHPIRGVLLEVEFIDVLAVDQLLNSGGNHQQVRQDTMNAVADAILSDLRSNPESNGN